MSVASRLVMLATLVLAASMAGSLNGASSEVSPEASARNLLRSIYENDTAAIIAMIPVDGILDGDTRFSRDDIVRELGRAVSPLRSHLDSPLAAAQLDGCNTFGGRVVVSPKVFYALYGDEVEITSNVIPESGGTHYGVKIAGRAPVRKINGCEVVLWPLILRKIDDRFYLGGLFFE